MKNFFKGISFTQVLAGSLAAVTSFLLASKIGIAGSVIGVAVDSIVSAVASQLYQNVIHASSRKLAEANDAHKNLADDDTLILSKQPANGCEADSSCKGAGDSSMQSSKQHYALNSSRTISSKTSEPELENTRVLELSALREQREEDMALSEGTIPDPIPLSQALHGTYATAYAADGKKGNGNSYAATIAIAVLSALLAVVVTAGVVLMLTQGKGTDNINHPEPSQQQQNPQPKQRVKTDTNIPKRKSSDDAENQDSADEDDKKNPNGNDGEDASSGNPGDADFGNAVGGSAESNSGESSNGSSGAGTDGAAAGSGAASQGSGAASGAGADARAKSGAGTSSNPGSSNSSNSSGSGETSGSVNGN